MKYSNLDEERDKLKQEIKRICKKFDIPPQILNTDDLAIIPKA